MSGTIGRGDEMQELEDIIEKDEPGKTDDVPLQIGR
jgi:hypothetical protein